MKILFASSEAVPYAASGGLADVVGTLPKAIGIKGHDCAVVIPLYKSIKQEFRDEMTLITTINVDVSWRKQYCGIFKAEYGGVSDEVLEALGTGALRLAVQEGNLEKGCFLAGQCAAMVKKEQPAAEILSEISEEAEQILRRASQWVK